MRMCRGNPKDKNSEQNLWIEAKELRSISRMIISACGLPLCMLSFTFCAFVRSLAGITILTPLFARTRAVSAPMPDVAPWCTKIKKTRLLLASVCLKCVIYFFKNLKYVLYLLKHGKYIKKQMICHELEMNSRKFSVDKSV